MRERRHHTCSSKLLLCLQPNSIPHARRLSFLYLLKLHWFVASPRLDDLEKEARRVDRLCPQSQREDLSDASVDAPPTPSMDHALARTRIR